jgi:hypothetical protein
VPRRLVLLGASNLVRGLRDVLRAAAQAWEGPLEVLGALGLGRSYGMRSRVLVRDLPPIAECGLWEELARRPPLPTRALVTDVGNDVLYNAPVGRILEWVDACVRRLSDAGAEVVMTGLPLQRLQRLSAPGYALMRTVLFPFHGWLPLTEALDRARALDEGLQRLAAERGAVFVRPRPEWYGLDPIHVRPGAWGRAWRAILTAPEADAPEPSTATAGKVPSWLRCVTAPPQRQWLFGREHVRSQPVLTLAGGGDVSLY